MEIKKMLASALALSIMLCGCAKTNQTSSSDDKIVIVNDDETTENTSNGELISYGDGISKTDTVLDVFENIELEYNGYSPNISVSVDTSKMRGFLKDNVTYTVKPDSGLKNGDKVIVTAMYNNSVMKSHDYVVEKDVLEMTINGDEIPEEDLVVIDGEMLKQISVICAESTVDGKILITASARKKYNGVDYLPINLVLSLETEETILWMENKTDETFEAMYKNPGDIVTIKVESYNKDFAQKNGFVIADDASFEVTAWDPRKQNNEGVMWFDEDGTEVYSCWIPDF